MDKKVKIGLLIALLIAYSCLYIVLFPTVKTGMCYPHDNLIKILNSIGSLIPVVIIMACIAIIVKTNDDFLAKIRILFCVFLILGMLSPLGVLEITKSIHKYDKEHYQPEACNQWKSITKENR